MEWTQPDWSTQLHHALECYNMTTEDKEEHPRNINILEKEGHHELKVPKIENPYIFAPLKMKQVNIDNEEELKFANIGDY